MLNTKVNLNNEQDYYIYSDSGFDSLTNLIIKDLNYKQEKIVVVTDSNVDKLYYNKLYEALSGKLNIVGKIVFTAGEENKNLSTVQYIYEELLKCNLDRKSVLIALGGGVVGDITGFCAATYLRGIRFIQVPTTLLSQVDSSVGGKTGVDFENKKNMIGAFYQPKIVYINPEVLLTLDDIQFKSGLGELTKHGIIRDEEFYEYLSINIEKILNRDLSCLQKCILRSCEIKADVVHFDERESNGLRQILNFGHTIGHAIETDICFQYPHGICVALGMICVIKLSHLKGLIDEELLEKLVKFIIDFDMVPHKPLTIHLNNVLDLINYDKKNENNITKFVLLKKIGETVIFDDVTKEQIIDSIVYLKGVISCLELD